MKMPLVGLFAVVLAAAGCHTPVNTVENAQKMGQPYTLADKRVVNDSELNQRVSVVGVNSALTSGGLLKVQVTLLNRTWSLHRFSYQFEWFDLNGMEINNLSPAVVADQIEGGETKYISAVAPSPTCKDFRLILMAAH